MDINVTDEAVAAIARFANGDARSALNLLEFAAGSAPIDPETCVRQLGLEQLDQSIQRRALLYDKGGEEHYNLISALHKSMRNSDPDAAVYWVARMLEAGEDPLYIAQTPGALRLRGRRQRRSAGADRRRRRQGRGAFHRHARRQHRARAGGDLSRHRAEEQRGLHRLQRRGGRRAHAGRRARAAPLCAMRRRS